MDILEVYQFCTFGGVERVLLNRAEAFKSNNLNVSISVGYLQDFGALEYFKKYIEVNQLENYLIPFLLSNDFSFDKSRFDLIFIIDTPQFFNKIIAHENVFVECHTPYIENRQYLKELPKNIKGIITPSNSFRLLLLSEFKDLLDIFIFPNSVPDEFFGIDKELLLFTKRPITYLSRIDSLKNFDEAVLILESVQARDDVFQIIIGQGKSINQRLSIFSKKGLLAKTLLRDKISFEKVPTLTKTVYNHRGVFLSSSKGESFGLSAAEFICRGVPVLLSDIPAHQELVQYDDRFLYPLGNIKIAQEKMNYILNNWDELSSIIKPYGENFRNKSFINSWLVFIDTFGYKNSNKLVARK